MDQQTPGKDNTLPLLGIAVGVILLIAVLAGAWFYFNPTTQLPPDGGNQTNTTNGNGTSNGSDNVPLPPAFPE